MTAPNSTPDWCGHAGYSCTANPPCGVHAPAPDSAPWATGWYVRKRHTYEGQVARVDGSVSALCSRYTGVYPNGTTSRNGHEVPMADSPEVLALPACKLCLRLLTTGRDSS